MDARNARFREPGDYSSSLTDAERIVIAFGELIRDSKSRALTDAEKAALDSARMVMEQMPRARLAEMFRSFKIEL